METYIAGIDIGTTGAKGMIFSLKGEPVASAYREYPCTYPKPGWVEQDADLLVRSTMEAMAEAVKKSGVTPENIAAVSVSAQRCCGIFLDAEEKMLRPMISWQDNRTPAEVEEIAGKIDGGEYYRRTGFPNATTWLLSKMMWVRKNEPGLWEKTRRVVQMHDYYLKALGTEEYFVDYNDAGFFGFYDSTANDWDKDLLDLFDIPAEILPIPAPSGKAVGKVSAQAAALCGLAEGTVIAIGAGDQSAGSLGAGIVRKGAMSISMGTAGAVTAYLDEPFRDPNGNIMITSHPQEGRWLLEGYQAAAAGVYRWYRDEIGAFEAAEAEKNGGDYYQVMNEKIAAVPAGAKGLVFMPYFAGAATPRYNSDARGTLMGLTFAHDRFCMARAFMEGISMDMRDMIHSMEKSGVTVKDVHILGGPTRSEVWNQIQADIYGLPVSTLKVTDATLLGAAILAGCGAGLFSSIEEGAENLVRIDRSYEPDNENHGLYQELYGIYQNAFEALEEREVFGKIAAIQG